MNERWWRGLDSNQRRLSQRIYSPSPLTTRAPLPASARRRACHWRKRRRRRCVRRVLMVTRPRAVNRKKKLGTPAVREPADRHVRVRTSILPQPLVLNCRREGGHLINLSLRVKMSVPSIQPSNPIVSQGSSGFSNALMATETQVATPPLFDRARAVTAGQDFGTLDGTLTLYNVRDQHSNIWTTAQIDSVAAQITLGTLGSGGHVQSQQSFAVDSITLAIDEMGEKIAVVKFGGREWIVQEKTTWETYGTLEALAKKMETTSAARRLLRPRLSPAPRMEGPTRRGQCPEHAPQGSSTPTVPTPSTGRRSPRSGGMETGSFPSRLPTIQRSMSKA